MTIRKIAYLFSIGLGFGCSYVHAQDYPAKPIRLIIPFPAGSPSDVLSRLLAPRLTDALKQPLVVENEPGAAGLVGVASVAKARADGYTLLMGGTGALAIIPNIYTQKRTGYDPITDFSPVSLVANVPFMVAVSPSVPVTSMKALVDLAKSRPGQLNYASSGVASTPQLAVELLKSITDINLTHVPYKGSAPALADLYSGQVHLMVTGITSLLPSVKAGKLRALSVADTKRSPLMPDVPTAIEAGIPGFTASVWTGLLAPAKTPGSIIALLNRETVKILHSQEIKDRFLGLGADPIGNQALQFEAYMREELQKWGKVVKSLGLNENNVDF